MSEITNNHRFHLFTIFNLVIKYMIYCFLTVYVFLGDYHGLIDFVRLLKVILKDKTSDYVVIAMDERLFTGDPATYFAKSKIIKTLIS